MGASAAMSAAVRSRSASSGSDASATRAAMARRDSASARWPRRKLVEPFRLESLVVEGSWTWLTKKASSWARPSCRSRRKRRRSPAGQPLIY